MTTSDVAGLLRGCQFRGYADEDGLQAAVLVALERAGVEAQREVRIDSSSRIDVMAGRVAIEVKVAGSAKDLLRQVARYARSPFVDGIVVVTVRVRHLRLPFELYGKPVEVVSLAGAGL